MEKSWGTRHGAKCSICAGDVALCFKAEVLQKYIVGYFFCAKCGFLQTENPHWLDEAYGTAIVDADTGLVQRNLSNSRILICLLYFLFGKDGKYLDLAGGYGMLTRLMRDYGFDFYWSDKFAENILAKGFELETTTPPFTAITAFEVLEHVYDPVAFLRVSLSESKARTIIFSTELFCGKPPAPEKWWYYSFQTGQHITFYQRRTLEYIAEKLSLFLYSNGGIHMLTDKKINPRFFDVLSGRYSVLLCAYARRRMQSKTFSDHEMLIAL